MTDLSAPEHRASATLPISGAGVRVAFIVTICLSAFLLFLIQPMFAKMALPLLGGAPNVWTTAMLFFQVVLLAGYAYAHWLGTRAGVRTQVLTHLTITLLASLCLPIAVASGWTPPQEGGATLWLLGLFAVSLGAPFFAVSANAPLLQKWYAATGNADSVDPYFLYAASNIGSFGALIAYPFVLEPMFGAAGQSGTWSIGYYVLIAALVFCGWLAIRGTAADSTPVETADSTVATAKPTWRETGIWIGLAFIPSSLMLSITAKIATDIGSFPLIWTVTLALYLLSYVFAFSQRLRPSPSVIRLLNVPLVITGLSIALASGHGLGNGALIMLCALLFTVALACHSTLAERRPAEAHLTRFYLAMSVGGALGGLFNSIIAPQIFNDVYEYPLILTLALLAAPGATYALRDDLKNAWPVSLVIAGSAIAVALMIDAQSIPLIAQYVPIALLAVFAVIWFRFPVRQTIMAFTLVAVSLGCKVMLEDAIKHRSFFGVYKIKDWTDQGFRTLSHGTTIHGSQLFEGDVLKPRSYYHARSPMGLVAQARAKDVRVAVVGLGTGSLACFHPNQVDWTFYEIDPLVDQIARNPDYFTFMRDCAGPKPTVIGDARLRMMEAEKAAFELIILDAFSSDAIPVHLLTAEAMEMYREKLTDDGLLLVHISNRHYDLAGPIAKVAEAVDMPIRKYFFDATEEDIEAGDFASIAVLMAKKEAAFGEFLNDGRWESVEPTTSRLWTDDYADILSARK